MSDFWFTILKAVVSVVAAVCGVLVTTYVIPWLKSLRENKDYEQLFALVEAGVRAAEQVIKTEHSGAEKKGRVIEFVSQYLMALGIEITDSQLSELIEAAVYSMKQELLVEITAETLKTEVGDNG